MSIPCKRANSSPGELLRVLALATVLLLVTGVAAAVFYVLLFGPLSLAD